MKLLYKKGMGIGNVSARLLMVGSPVVNYHTVEAANAIMVLSRLNKETQVSPFIKKKQKQKKNDYSLNKKTCYQFGCYLLR